jgi:hypothetical protein
LGWPFPSLSLATCRLFINRQVAACSAISPIIHCLHIYYRFYPISFRFMAQPDQPSISTHVYQALEGPEHIRLILLYPALSKDAPLRIKFLSSILKDLEGRYEAISYTWGQPILDFPLYFDDGTRVYVTHNLDRALRYLRRSDRNRLLWADAACINQTNNKEKAVQIPLMVQIFRSARKVMAWLHTGKDTTVEQDGMRTIELISRTSQNRVRISTEDCNKVWLFLRLPWFTRLWIVQEVVFNLHVNLICGGMELNFSQLVVALRVLERRMIVAHGADGARMRAIAEIGKLWNYHSILGEQSNWTRSGYSARILSLVENFSCYECTDARDRIFAVYSMATDVRPIARSFHSASTRLTIDPIIPVAIDYSLDVRETYHNFARGCWGQTRASTQMWEALLSRQHCTQAANWYSWAPDWRIAPRRTWRGSVDDLNCPSVMWSNSDTNFLRIKVKTGGFPPNGESEDFWTIRLKTSRTAGDNRIPLLSQLSELYTLLQNPRRFVISHHQLILEPKATRSTNILIDMIRVLLLDSEHAKSLVELDRHLATMTGASEGIDLKCDTILPSVCVQDLVSELDRKLADSELFCFQDARTQIHSVGFGNKRMEMGDRIVYFGQCTPGLGSRGERRTDAIMVLILRKVDYADDAQLPTFRLIGSGSLLNANSVCLEGHSFVNLFRVDREIRAEKAAWEEFQSSFGSYGSYQYLNLA